VIGAAVVNATFEEILWRVELPRLFHSREWLALQWAGLSVGFGISHLHGIPEDRSRQHRPTFSRPDDRWTSRRAKA
jgi:hypothetical protein